MEFPFRNVSYFVWWWQVQKLLDIKWTSPRFMHGKEGFDAPMTDAIA